MVSLALEYRGIFQKYLINEDGKLAKVISPRTQPDDPTILSWIEN